MSVETWYVMEDGSVADPRFIVRGADGRLHHTDGRAVAYAPHGPRSRSVDPDVERARVPAPPAPLEPAPAARADMQAEPAPDPKPRRPYKTRESKAD